MKPGRAERKNRRLSSQNRKRSGRKKAEKKGKGRKRKQKASTCGTAVGAKQGRTKGNIQKAKYIEPEKKAWETRLGTRGKTWNA